MEVFTTLTILISGIVVGYFLAVAGTFASLTKTYSVETGINTNFSLKSGSPLSESMLNRKTRSIGIAFFTAMMWIAVFANYGLNGQFILAASVVAVSAIIVASDIEKRIIPNQTVMALLLLGLVSTQFEMFGAKWSEHLFGLLIGAAIFLIPCLIKGSIGAGDVKFMAVAGLILGINKTLLMCILLTMTLLIWMIVMKMLGKKIFKRTVAFGPFIALSLALSLVIPLV